MFLTAAWWIGLDHPLTGPLVLYSAESGVLPESRPWNWGYYGTGGEAAFDQGASLDTVDTLGWQAGWFRTSWVPLDRRAGFEVRVVVQVEEEKHGMKHRAGGSLIVLDSTARGIEIGFWKDEVWVQGDKPLFRHGESLGVDSGEVVLNVRFLGDRIRIEVNGEVVETGIKDYSGFRGFPNPYSTPNFLFWGDNTHAAGLRGSLKSFVISPLS